MKKTFIQKSNFAILFICFLLSFNIGFCQSGIIGASGGSQDFVTGTSVTQMTASVGTSQILALKSLGTGNRYFRLVRNGNIQMGPNTTCGVGSDKNISSLLAQTVAIGDTSCSSGGWFINCPNTTDNYVFKLPTINAKNNFVCFRVQGPIQTVTAVSTPSGGKVIAGQSYNVKITTSGAFSIGQTVYMRYSNDNFTTSDVVAMAGSATSYTAVIPGSQNTLGATIKYYVFTSGNVYVMADGSNADLYSINSNGSTTTPYSYKVANCKADFNITSDTIQCLPGNYFTLTNSSNVVSPETLTYFWNFGDGSTSTSPSSAHSYSTANTYNVKLNITSSNTSCKDSIVKQIKVNALPSIPIITLSSTTVVAGQTNVIYTCSTVPNATSYTWHYTGTGATINGNGTNSINVDFSSNATGGDLVVVADNGTNCSSSPTSVTVAITPLPVTLSSFSAKKLNNTTIINWVTASEINTKSFEVQRSINNSTFVNIGTIMAKGLANSYAFVDEKTSLGLSYYRLKQIDNDGKFSFSNVLAVEIKNKESFTIAPNPAKDIANINCNLSGYLTITNLLGIEVKTQSLSMGNNRLDISNLSKGVYFVSTITNEGKTTKKLVVE
ncbi:MAG: PKD domain-containing protein [Bacteroidetes bacterium]|nr:PKD domain-containing protein [Bacteroidota bacterium]